MDYIGNGINSNVNGKKVYGIEVEFWSRVLK